MEYAKKNTGTTIIIVILAVVVLGGLGAGMRARTGENGEDGGFWAINFPEIVINLISPDSGGQDLPDWPDFPDYEIPENSRAPTDITIFVAPNEVDMGDWIIGTVTSNGYNWPLSVTVTHTGSGQSGELAGWLGANGQFEIYQEVNVPGVYEATAIANGVTDGPITFVVRGILVDCDGGFYSKTMSDSKLIRVYTHHTRQNAGVVGHYPTGSYSRAITNVMINAGGYAEVAPNLDALANGDWELDAIIGGDSAMAWGATYWVRIGR